MRARLALPILLLAFSGACGGSGQPAADQPAGGDGDSTGAAAASAAGGEWQELEGTACLDAYSACLDSLDEQQKEQLWLPYDQLRAGIETLRDTGDETVVSTSCNDTMRMFRERKLC